MKNVSGYDDINPIVRPFLQGDRKRDLNNFGPRIGFAWTSDGGGLQVHGGYGIYYDRVTLEIISLERGLDGRALPIEVRAATCSSSTRTRARCRPFAPTFANPFTGFILPGAGASGINIIDNRLQNPTVQQLNLGTQVRLPRQRRAALDLVHNLGTHFIIGRPIGEVFNPVVGGPDRVVNLESSVNTKYDALLATLEKRFGRRPAAPPRPIRCPVRATTRTTTRSRSARAPRPERPLEGVRADAQRAAPSVECSRARSCCRARARCRRCGRSRPACPWTS